MLWREAGNRKQHDRNLEYLGPDRDGALAVAVCEVTTGHRKQNKGQGEEQAHEQNLGLFLFRRQIGADDQVEDEVLEGVVVERSLELGGDQTPETQAPGTRSVAHAVTSTPMQIVAEKGPNE